MVLLCFFSLLKCKSKLTWNTTTHTVRMAVINKSTNNKCWRGCGKKGTFLHCWWECKPVQPLWRTVWRYLRKLCIELPYNPAIPLLGIYPDKTFLKKRHMTPHVHCSSIHNSQDMETTQITSADDWIRKMWYIYIMEYYLAINNNKILPFAATWMELETFILSEVS